MDPVLVPIWPEGGQALGIGRTLMFELVKNGDIATVSIGRRRLVPVQALRDFAQRLQADQAGGVTAA